MKIRIWVGNSTTHAWLITSVQRLTSPVVQLSSMKPAKNEKIPEQHRAVPGRELACRRAGHRLA
jgi:hypothetical protein